LDGLLLDTEPHHSRAWSQAATRFGLLLAPDQLLSLRGRRRNDNAELVRAWIGEAGQAVPTAAELLAVQQPVAQRLLQGAAPMPGARGLLERLRDLQVAMALVTSSGRDAVERKCAPHPWLGIISERVLGDDPQLCVGKPARNLYILVTQMFLVWAGMWLGHQWFGELGVVIGTVLAHWLLYPVAAVVFGRLGLWTPRIDVPVLGLSALVTAGAVMLIPWSDSPLFR
jgi:beta-phosphoglucomutase-like phosphatase (HAD superfamily)